MDIVRRIKAILTADAGQFSRELGGATRSVTDLGNASERLGGKRSGFDQLSASIRENSAAWDEVSNKSLIAGGALAAGLGLATREAISWESAWAGVLKTVDGSPEQMAALEEELRNLTRVLPATHEELAAVAEAAGQLGVAREDLIEFTETAVGLGESTNLSADEAATGLAQLANVMGTTTREGVEGYSRLGSTLVALGNDGASTEKQILDMSLRIAGAAQVVGASEADVLALANALSSVGVEAELGGGVVSRTMLTINTAVSQGGDALTRFANVAGLSAQEFTRRWEEDPVEVVGQFVAGLGRVTQSGGDAATTLDDLGLAGTQNAQVLLRAAGASDLLNDSLELGARSWEENVALTEEASKRYETTESKLRLAQNSMRDAAIDAGSVLGPALAEVAGWAASAADAFVKLPDPLQSTAVGLAGIGSAGLLAFGGTVKVVRTAQDLSDAMGTLAETSPRAADGLGKVGKAAGGALALAGLATALGNLQAAIVPSITGLEDLQAALIDLNNDGSADALNDILLQLGDQSGRSRVLMGQMALDVDSFAEALDRIDSRTFVEQVTDVRSVLPGFKTEADQAREAFELVGEALVATARTAGPAEAASQFRALTDELGGGEEATRRLLEVMPAYAAYLQDVENQSELTGGATKGWADRMREVREESEETSQQIRDLADAILEQYNAALTASNGAIAYEAALDAVTAAIEENGKTAIEGGAALDVNTEKGRDNAKALNVLAAQALATAEANLANGDSVGKVGVELEDARDAFIDAAVNMGLNRDAAEEMADKYGIARGTAQELKDSLNELPGNKTTIVDVQDLASGKVSYIKRSLDGLTDRIVTVRVVTSGTLPNGGTRLGGGLMQADGGVLANTSAGLVQAYASGGTFAGQLPRIRPYAGPRGVLWGEEGSGPWEAFISGHPQKRSRSRDILEDVATRLGGRVEWVAAYANGGIRETSNIANHYYAPPPTGGRDVQVNIPVQTVERADPVAIGAQVAWQVGGLP